MWGSQRASGEQNVWGSNPGGSMGFLNTVTGLLSLALVLALAVGWVCLGFIFAIEKVMVLVYEEGGHDHLAQWVGSADFVRIFEALVVGGLVVGSLTYYLIPERTNVGFNGVLRAANDREGFISWQEGLGVGISSVVSIGCGASVGRYGPAVHIGAAAGSVLATMLGLQSGAVLTLLAAGSAAAIAASFHAPFAGVLFAHEVILRDSNILAFAPVTLAAVVGMLVGENHNGGRSVFW